MNRFAALYDNAMLYKDLTQWIRSKTYLTLFIGLLTFGEFIAAFFAYLDTGGQPAGPIAFGFLIGILCVYIVIIGLGGMVLTGKEFGNRTFELYEMAGMSLEKMVFGKFSSMISQFLFGFFCIVPFVFFSYLLGGLDFYTVIGSVLLITFVTPPMFLVFLMLAFVQKGKGGNILARVIVGFFTLYAFMNVLAPIMLMMAFRGGGGIGFGAGPAALINWMLLQTGEAAATLAGVLVLYVLFCLLMFYIACHNISPVCDSRETAVKFLTTALCLAWMGFHAVIVSFSSAGAVGPSELGVGLAPAYISMLALGLVFFFSPIQPPRMTVIRREHASVHSVPVYQIFAPGPNGTITTLLVLILASIVFAFFVYVMDPSGSSPDSSMTYFYLISLPLQVPFFLVFPAGWLFNFRRFAARPKVFRLTVFAWWLMVTALIAISSSVARYIWHANDIGSLIDVLSIFASPLTTLFVGVNPRDYSTLTFSAPILRIVTGIIGLFLMTRVVSRRRAMLIRAAASKTALSPPETASGDSENIPEAID